MRIKAILVAVFLTVLFGLAPESVEACATCNVEQECVFAETGGTHCEIFFETDPDSGEPGQFCNYVGFCGSSALLDHPQLTPAGTFFAEAGHLAPDVLPCNGFIVAGSAPQLEGTKVSTTFSI